MCNVLVYVMFIVLCRWVIKPVGRPFVCLFIKKATNVYVAYNIGRSALSSSFSNVSVCCTDVIAGGNLAFMCCKVKAAVDREQKKIIWIPAVNFT